MTLHTDAHEATFQQSRFTIIKDTLPTRYNSTVVQYTVTADDVKDKCETLSKTLLSHYDKHVVISVPEIFIDEPDDTFLSLLTAADEISAVQDCTVVVRLVVSTTYAWSTEIFNTFSDGISIRSNNHLGEYYRIMPKKH
jgi:hypothetical protein